MIEAALTTVEVKDLCLFGKHGVLAEENRLGQRFLVDVTVQADMTFAQEHDRYDAAVCYGAVCDVAVAIVTGPPLALIETVADRVAEAILTRFDRVERVQVRVRKPGVPLPYALREASAMVIRQRQHEVAFSLGANQGHREATLSAALDALGTAAGLTVTAVSSLYDSTAWGKKDQPAFVNLCALAKTTHTPHALLQLCKSTERMLGRQVGEVWGERVLDIDILYYDHRILSDRVLTLPHPHMFERAFVLVPLVEIDPESVIAGRSVKDALASLVRTPGDAVQRVA